MSRHPLHRRDFARLMLLTAMAVLPGVACRPDKPASQPASSGPAPDATLPVSRPASRPAPEEPAAADDQDAPDAPRALPKSVDLAGWVKIEPVRLTHAADLGDARRAPDAGPAAEAAGLAMLGKLGARRVAHCVYRHEASGVAAAVIFAEMSSPDDAFAALALRTPLPARWDPADASFTVTDGARMLACKAAAFVEIELSRAITDLPANPADGLLGRILFALPAAEPPLLLRALPPDRLVGTKIWHVRSAQAFQDAQSASSEPAPAGVQAGLRVLRAMDPAAVDARLGLSGDRMLSVAAVPLAGDEPPNLIWFVRYATPAEAAEAHERYCQALAGAKAGLDANTLVMAPSGGCLVGSWTADQESLQNLLPRLRERLPE